MYNVHIFFQKRYTANAHELIQNIRHVVKPLHCLFCKKLRAGKNIILHQGQHMKI